MGTQNMSKTKTTSFQVACLGEFNSGNNGKATPQMSRRLYLQVTLFPEVMWCPMLCLGITLVRAWEALNPIGLVHSSIKEELRVSGMIHTATVNLKVDRPVTIGEEAASGEALVMAIRSIHSRTITMPDLLNLKVMGRA